MADDFDPDAYIQNFDPDASLADTAQEAPAQSAAPEFDPDQYIRNFDPDKYLASQEPEAEGHIAADAREIAHGVVPMAAGVAGAGAVSALAAPVTAAATVVNPILGGAVALGFGAAGMLGGAYLGEKAQDAVLKKGFGYDDDVLRAANRKARPIETQVAGLLPFAGNPAATLGQRAAGAGMMGAFSGGQQLARGEFDPAALATDVAFGAVMPNGNRVTRAIHGAAEGAVEKYAPGRPDTQPRPGADADKADANVSQSPSVAGNNATAQQPAADPKAPIGQENSKAAGPENYAKKKVAIENSPFAAEPKDTGFSQGDVTTDKTVMSALAPETKGQVIDTGIEEAAAQQAAPAPDLRKQQAAQMNAEILKQYPSGKMPSDVRERFNANVQLLRGKQQAALAPEPAPQSSTSVIVNGKPVQLPTVAPRDAPPVTEIAKGMMGDIKGVSPEEISQAVDTAAEYTPEQQAARLADIEARNITPEPAAPVGFTTAKGSKYVVHEDGTTTRDKAARADVGHEGDSGMKPRTAKTIYVNGDASRLSGAGLQGDVGGKGYRVAIKDGKATFLWWNEKAGKWGAPESGRDIPFTTMPEVGKSPVELWRPADDVPGHEAYRGQHAGNKITELAHPITPIVKDGLARQTAKAQADMITRLRAEGKNDLADRYEAMTPEQRQEIHAQLANGLRDRASKAGSLRNNLGAETKNATQRDQHNRAIDAVQKAFDAHPPKENETGPELTERLRAAVDTANTAHGGNPLSRKGGYLPRAMPESFQWLRLVQQNALRNPAYWTNDKLAAFKTAEEDLRSKLDKSEYPTKNPELLDRGIEMNRRGGGDVAESLGERRGYNPEDEINAALDAHRAGQSIEEAVEAVREGRKPFDIDTEERETDSKPRITPVTDAKTLAALKPKARLIDATTPEGAAEIEAIFDRGSPTKKIPTAEAREGKPLTDEEVVALSGKPPIKGSQIDPAEKARLAALMNLAQSRGASRAAPKKSYVQGEKYKDEVKDLTGRLIQSARDFGANEQGGVPFDKIEAAVKGLIGKLRKEANAPGKKGKVYDTPLEVGPHLTSYIAKAPYSAENNAGRKVADRMNVVAKTDNMIRVGGLQEQQAINDALRPQTRSERLKEGAKNKLDQIKGKGQEIAPDLADARARSRQMYDALESKDASKIKDDATREIFETQVLPKQLETEFIRATIREQFPEANIGRETEDGVHRLAVNGGPLEAAETIGTNADPVAGNNPLSTARKSPMLERPFVVLEGVKSGKRTVIHMASDPNGKFTGDFTAWDKHKPIDVDAPKLEFELGGVYEMGGRKFKMRDATTDEIEAHALGNDGEPMQYKRDIAASVISANVYHRQLLNHLQALEELKQSPEFANFATISNNAPKVASGEWKKSDTPGFEKYWMDPHVREALRDAYQPGINDDALNVARNLSRALTKTIFWNPIVHQLNVGYHWVVERGFKWLPGDGNYRELAETGATAIKSVVKQDKLQQVLAEHGAGNIYGGVYSEGAHQKLGLALGEMMAKEPNKWGPVARTLDLSVGDLIRSVYKASSRAMWSVNDMLLTQAILSDLKHFNKTVDTASKAEIRESINRVERHIPNYRLPARVIGSGEGGRFLSAKQGDPLYFAFGRYHYGVFNSFANIVKNVVKGSGADRTEAIGHLMTMGALAFVVWPYIYKPIAQALTGNEDASVRGRGPMGPISHIREMRETGDYGPLYRETLSFSPLIAAVMDISRNKDFGGNPILDRKDLSDALHGSPKGVARSGAQALGYAAQTGVAPLGTLNSALSNKNQGVLGGLRDQVTDVKNPSPAAAKWMNTQERSQQRDHTRRVKKEPNIGDKFLGAVGLD